MQTVTLAYTLSSVNYSRDFKIYSASVDDVELQKTVKKSLAGNLFESAVGYRYLVSIDFAPLGSGSFTQKEDAYWLYGFKIGAARTVTFDGVTRNVVVEIDGGLQFNFFNGVSFAAGFSMSFYETSIRTVSDTGSVLTIRPTYTPNIHNLLFGVLRHTVDFCDELSVEAETYPLTFVNGNHDDVSYGYRHRFRVDFPPVLDASQRDWLVDYCLWTNKQLDTRDIDVDNGVCVDVVVEDAQMKWTLENGVKGLPSLSLTLIEKTMRTVPEVYVEPPPDVHFVIGKSKLGKGRLG